MTFSVGRFYLNILEYYLDSATQCLLDNLVSEDSEKEDDAMENIKFLSSRALFLEEGNDSSDNEDEKYS